jgi:hypothetical protein
VEALLLDHHLQGAAITVDIEIVVVVTETPTEAAICGKDEIHGATEVLAGGGAMEIIGLVALVVTEVRFQKSSVYSDFKSLVFNFRGKWRWSWRRLWQWTVGRFELGW